MNMDLKGHRKAMKAWLMNVRFTAEYHQLAMEYIAEAEHQDGEEYWDQFQDYKELAEDFDAYCYAVKQNEE
jgi:hypothetical protein